MQRIPNPVSDPSIFVRVFREIHGILSKCTEFGIDDISRAMIATNNVTSQGAIGDEALRRSTRKDRSLDGIYNQSKMYAELFRTLGWIQSTTSKLTYSFSLLGDHIATAHNPVPLLSECLLGIAYPNEVLGVKGDQRVRVIGSILLVMDSLGSISRDEMMAGPMSIADDSDPRAFSAMLQKLQKCRREPSLLDKWLDEIASRRHIKRGSTMTNYTRFPIGTLRGTGWCSDQRGKPLQITDSGKVVAANLRTAPDLRLINFNSFPDAAKPAFIRWTLYRMLERAGFDVDSVKDTILADESILKSHGLPHSGRVFFSPFQQLSRETINKWTPELVHNAGDPREDQVESLVHSISNGSTPSRQRAKLMFELSERTSSSGNQSQKLMHEIQATITKSKSKEAATEALFIAYSSVNKDIFYPLVANLFCILGFDCRVSRGGQNYERADAIIIDAIRCIPIEIKSPGEETEISVKGVRQALENKVVLLSRKSYPTDWETTSLVVGFNPPNDRSEVHELVEDIRKAFNVRIGVIDFRTLLSLAVHVVDSGLQLNFHDFHNIQGVIRVEYLSPER